MWLVTKDGFISVVAYDGHPGMLRVRARRREHLAQFDSRVMDLGPDAPDYRWHADVPRGVFMRWLVDSVERLDYTSHVKEACSGSDTEMYDAMLGAWASFMHMQDNETPVHGVRKRRHGKKKTPPLPGWVASKRIGGGH